MDSEWIHKYFRTRKKNIIQNLPQNKFLSAWNIFGSFLWNMVWGFLMYYCIEKFVICITWLFLHVCWTNWTIKPFYVWTFKFLMKFHLKVLKNLSNISYMRFCDNQVTQPWRWIFNVKVLNVKIHKAGNLGNYFYCA